MRHHVSDRPDDRSHGPEHSEDGQSAPEAEDFVPVRVIPSDIDSCGFLHLHLE
jgi:hypothetical protein